MTFTAGEARSLLLERILATGGRVEVFDNGSVIAGDWRLLAHEQSGFTVTDGRNERNVADVSVQPLVNSAEDRREHNRWVSSGDPRLRLLQLLAVDVAKEIPLVDHASPRVRPFSDESSALHDFVDAANHYLSESEDPTAFVTDLFPVIEGMPWSGNIRDLDLPDLSRYVVQQAGRVIATHTTLSPDGRSLSANPNPDEARLVIAAARFQSGVAELRKRENPVDYSPITAYVALPLQSMSGGAVGGQHL